MYGDLRSENGVEKVCIMGEIDEMREYFLFRAGGGVCDSRLCRGRGDV